MCVSDCQSEVRWELFSAHVLMRHLAQCEAAPPVMHKASVLSSPKAISTGTTTSYGKKICRRIHWSLLGLNGAKREVKAYREHCEHVQILQVGLPESCASTHANLKAEVMSSHDDI